LLAGASLGGFAQYDRGAVLQGEVWRLVTGHFSHWSAAQLRYDLFAFVVLGAICEVRDRARFAMALAATAVLVSLFLLALRPDVVLYRGLSALDSALWMLAVFGLGERRPRLAVALASLFLLKVLIESRSGAVFVGGITVLPIVHLIGASAGSIMGAWRCPTRSRSSFRQPRSASCARRSMRSLAASSSIASNAPPAPT
jgi:rhomboid family GlyGly-CTERM serine protease